MNRQQEKEIIQTLVAAGHEPLAKTFARSRGYRVRAAMRFEDLAALIEKCASMGKPCVLSSDEAELVLDNIKSARFFGTEGARELKKAVRTGNDADLTHRDTVEMLRYL